MTIPFTTIFFFCPQVGQYRNGSLTRLGPNFYARTDELGGCELSVMVQPPFLPYVARKDDRHPGGIVEELMTMLANSMNFTLKYVWSSTYEGMMEHLLASDLNVFMDMMPRASTPATNYRFSVGITKVTFIVPRSGRREGSMLSRLLSPSDSSVYVGILAIFLGLMGVSWLAGYRDLANVLLKTFGSLLGIGVGKYPNLTWMKIFLWFWLLPSYVLIQAYLACLTKQFAFPSIPVEIDSINELVNSDLDVLCGSGTFRAICSQRESIFQALCQKCRLVNDETIWDEFYPNFLKTRMMNNTAVIANLEYLNAHPAFLHVHAINGQSTNVNQLIEVRPGSAYIFVMGNLYDRLFASGLIQFWKELYSNRARHKLTNSSKEFILREFHECCFFLLFVGLAISSICFIAEIIMYNYINKK